MYSPDGKFIVYNARVSGNQKLFRLDLDTKKKTQLTFGTQDETAAQFIDDHTLVFSSTATDPAVPLEPEVAKNGNIYNIWTLDLKNGELRQYTDALGGNWSPVVLNEGGARATSIAFISYYKGEYSIHTLERKEPLHTAASSDFGAPGPIIDFQAPLQHTLVKENNRKKGTWEKMFLEGRPPVNVGVTSNGDLFGGTQVSFGDVLGDKQINFFAASISQYRTLSLSYVNLSRRFQYALQGYSQTQFFYGQLGGVFYDPSYTPFIDRDLAIATRTVRGGSAIGIYPFDRYRRVEVSGGVLQLNEEYNDPGLQAQAAQDYQQQQYGPAVFRNGTLVPLGVVVHPGDDGVPGIRSARRQHDARWRTTSRRRSATRCRARPSTSTRATTCASAAPGCWRPGSRGSRASATIPDFLYFGGNSDLRGYDYLEFAGQNVVVANAELRFPLIEAALTPIGVIGGIRGVFFAGIGGAWFNNQPSSDPVHRRRRLQVLRPAATETCRVVTGAQINATNTDYVRDANGNPVLTYGPPQTINGFRLKDGRASYGVGLETFALGFPIHFDWSWRTTFNKAWEDVLFAGQNGCSINGTAAARVAQAALRGLDRLRLLVRDLSGLGARG